MKINGIEGLTNQEINYKLEEGGKFVVYQYCVSILIMTFKRRSNIYFIKDGESAFLKGVKFSLVSLLFGWWGIPWGPIHTISSLMNNCKGGKNVTTEVISSIDTKMLQAEQEQVG